MKKLSGIFSPVNDSQEKRVFEILQREIPNISVTLSSTIGHMGLLERENASILNECLKPLCQNVLSGLRDSIMEILGSECGIYLTQNDGTLLEYGLRCRLEVRKVH
jgi:N-methylhydantoinase A/oxoprolinase/acetone carboxylase beta subunit